MICTEKSVAFHFSLMHIYRSNKSILVGFDDIKMWASLLTGENRGTEYESNVCFSLY